MQSNLSINDLITALVQEIKKFGLGSVVNWQYWRVYENFKAYAASKGGVFFSDQLLEEFLQHIEERHQAGVLGDSRRRLLRRASLLLKDYAVNKALPWKLYVFKHQPIPHSNELLSLHNGFIDHLRSAGKSENTIQSCRNSIRQFLLFLEDLGCTTLTAATPVMVPQFFQHMLATYQPTSIRVVASNIRRFLNFAQAVRLLPAVPSRCVRHTPIIPILTEEEMGALNRFLASADIPLRDKAISLLALRTGMRAADIVGLKLADIDWVNDTISIVQSKTGKACQIPLTAEVGNALSSYILQQRPKTGSPRVFLRRKAPFRQLSDHAACYAVVRWIFHQAGIRLGHERKGIHVMRHSLASRMLRCGVPVTTISSVLGHANKTSTEVYLQTDEARMRQCALSLDDIPMSCEVLK